MILTNDGIKQEIEDAQYGNHCISPEVKACEMRDIGEWDDSHPLNHCDTSDAEYRRLFHPNGRGQDETHPIKPHLLRDSDSGEIPGLYEKIYLKLDNCLWATDSDGFWGSSCDYSFEFQSGDPFKNGFHYCPKCGKKIEMSNKEN